MDAPDAPPHTPHPQLGDVLYLLAYNGYTPEVDGGALGITPAVWRDERLLRLLANKEYPFPAYASKGSDGHYYSFHSRLEHAVNIHDLDRVRLLSIHANKTVATHALTAAVRAGCGPRILAALTTTPSNADVNTALSGLPQLDATLPGITGSRDAVCELLRTCPAVSPRVALQVALAATLPDAVRTYLDEGMSFWLNDVYPDDVDPSFYDICEFWLLSRGGLLGAEHMRRHRTPAEVECVHLLFAHPSFTLANRLEAAGRLNDEAWLRELLGPIVAALDFRE